MLTYCANAESCRQVIGAARSRRVLGEPAQDVEAVEKSVSGCERKIVWVTMKRLAMKSPASERVHAPPCRQSESKRRESSLTFASIMFWSVD